MNKLIIIIIGILLATLNSLGQNATVRGVVKDSFGPVIGATVMVDGTTIGVTTDMEGNFVLDNVPDVKKAVLVIRYVGMNEVKERLNGRTSGIVIENCAISLVLPVRISSPFTFALIPHPAISVTSLISFVLISFP